MHTRLLVLAAIICLGVPSLSCLESIGEMKDLFVAVVISLLVVPRVVPHFDR